MAAKIFVRLDENSRVLEKYRVSGDTVAKVRNKFKSAITKRRHADYADYFIEVADSHNPKDGEHWNGSTFETYVYTAEEKATKNRRKAKREIEKLRIEAIDLLISNSEDAAVKVISDKISIEKGKL